MFQIENSKQAEFLGDIRDVGMCIVVGRMNGKIIEETFIPYAEYIEDEGKVREYLTVIYDLAHSKPTPDELLLGLGAFTLDIIYEDIEEEDESICLF